MIENEILLYQELVDFCNDYVHEIDNKFERKLEFSQFHKECYEKMFYANRHISEPPSVMELKTIIPDLRDAYKKASNYFKPRNKYRKNFDIQLGQWYEKALKMFFLTKGFCITKKGFPFPDFEVKNENGDILAYFELKYIESPFLLANKIIENTYPYKTTRYDYEASLTLDTGQKLHNQKARIKELEKQDIPVHFIWWFDSFHIKGIFAMDAHKVYDYYDHVHNLHERKIREGDLETKQETGKIYPPLLEMTTFSEYLEFLNSIKASQL